MLVEINGLSKYYREFAALDDCTFSIEPGEVFGLLGPNGAGKSTLIRLMLGFLRPTFGSAKIASLDCYSQSFQVRQLVSYLPGDVRLFGGMKGLEVIRMLNELRGDFSADRVHKLAQELELDLTKRVAQMSTGTRQKLALVSIFATQNRVLILDEPTSNLDPTIRNVVSQLVGQAKSQGRTVLLSSHVLSEVEDVCDRVAILRQGKLVHVQAMKELRRRHRIRATARETSLVPPEHLRSLIDTCETAPGQLVIETSQGLMPILRWLSDLNLEDLSVEPAGLRSVYEAFHPKSSLAATAIVQPSEI